MDKVPPDTLTRNNGHKITLYSPTHKKMIVCPGRTYILGNAETQRPYSTVHCQAAVCTCVCKLGLE